MIKKGDLIKWTDESYPYIDGIGVVLEVGEHYWSGVRTKTALVYWAHLVDKKIISPKHWVRLKSITKLSKSEDNE